MFERKSFNPKLLEKLPHEAPVVVTAGDIAATIATEKLPSVLRRKVVYVSVTADNAEAESISRTTEPCFAASLSLGLSRKGHGKNAVKGFETFETLKDDLSFAIEGFLAELNHRFGITPSLLFSVLTGGGTSVGWCLVMQEDMEEVVRSFNPKAAIVELLSLSRRDFESQIANSLLALWRLSASLKDKTLVLSYFDRDPLPKKLADLNIVTVLATVLMASERAGHNKLDLMDVLFRGACTAHTEFLHVGKTVEKKDAERVIRNALDKIRFRSRYSRATFGLNEAESLRLIAISPTRPVDLVEGAADFSRLVRDKSAVSELYVIEGVSYIPLLGHVILKTNESNFKNFLESYASHASKLAETQLREYREAGLFSNDYHVEV